MVRLGGRATGRFTDRRRRGRAMEVGREWVIDPQAPNLARLVTFDALLGPGEGRTLLDLGAGPCLFARRAQKAGWKVTAVDGRTDRLPEDLEGVTFVEA